MPTVINTNLASLYAQNNLSNAQNNLALSVQRLSSGLRINSAKDDAAGLAISQNMQGQINGINQSVKNLNNATNMIQVADTSLATIQDMLLRMKQLAVQGYDGSLSNAQRGNIIDELSQLNSEILNTSERAEFNENKLLNNTQSVNKATASSTAYLAATAAGSTVTDISVSGTASGTYTLTWTAGTNTLTASNGASISGSVVLSNTAIGDGVTTSFDIAMSDNSTMSFQVTAKGAADGLDDIGALIGTAANSKNSVVVTGAGNTYDFQSGPTTATFITISAVNMRTDGSGVSGEAMRNLGNQLTVLTGYQASPPALLSTYTTAFKTFADRVDAAVDYASDKRSYFGAQMNRLSYLNTNLQSQSTNLQSSKSAILDTDFAAETAKLTKGQIMQQAATAMLAQANQMPNVVLSLLK
jgi:flagellin